jgi:hypothetical protein
MAGDQARQAFTQICTKLFVTCVRLKINKVSESLSTIMQVMVVSQYGMVTKSLSSQNKSEYFLITILSGNMAYLLLLFGVSHIPLTIVSVEFLTFALLQDLFPAPIQTMRKLYKKM